MKYLRVPREVKDDRGNMTNTGFYVGVPYGGFVVSQVICHRLSWAGRR